MPGPPIVPGATALPTAEPTTHWTAEAMHRYGAPLARGLGRLLSDLVVTGAPPADGAAIVAANHYSHVDPVVVGAVMGRQVRYLAVDELFGRSRFFDALTLWLGAIPISRVRAPLGAMRTSLQVLQRGGAVALFPEGRRVAEWGESPPKRGAAWLALLSGAPIVPMAILGTADVLGVDRARTRRPNIRVWVGAPIDADAYLDRVDPIGAVMADWYEWMDRRLRPDLTAPTSPSGGASASSVSG